MTFQAVLLPVFVQVGLTIFIGLWLGRSRASLLKHGKIDRSEAAVSKTVWPARVQQIGNCYANQFEAPILFYLLVVLAWLARKADLTFVIMEWLFVAARIAHAAVQTVTDSLAPDYLRRRGATFGIGIVLLIAMWLVFAMRLYFQLP